MGKDQKAGINGGHNKTHCNTSAPRKRQGPTKAEYRLSARVKDYEATMQRPCWKDDPVGAHKRPGSARK